MNVSLRDHGTPKCNYVLKYFVSELRIDSLWRFAFIYPAHLGRFSLVMISIITFVVGRLSQAYCLFRAIASLTDKSERRIDRASIELN